MSRAAAKPLPPVSGLSPPWPAMIILLACGLAYVKSLSAPFLFDDFFSIHQNPTIRQLWPLSGPLSPPADGSGVDGRPLVNLSFALNHAVDGFEVLGYHLANLVIHLLAALALYGVVRRTLGRMGNPDPGGRRLPSPAGQLAEGQESDGPGRRAAESVPCQSQAVWLALAIALGWMLHPLQTESVTSVVQRTESLMGMFFLATFYAFVRAAEDPASRWWPAAAVATCLAGMATKEVMVTAPLLVLLFDRTFFAGTFAAAWKARRGLHLALTATMLVVFWLLWKSGASRGSGLGGAAGVDSWSYLLTQAKALVLYVRLALWPQPLVIDYGTDVVRSLGEVWLPGLAILAALGLTAYALVRRPIAGFLGAWFFVILAPSSSVVPLATQTMAEHRMYLPLAAIVVALALAMRRLGGRAAGIAGIAVLLFWAGGTVARNHDYRTPVALWEQTVRHQPRNERAHNNLGQALYQEGRLAEAVPILEAAIALQPSSEAHGLLALTLAGLGRSQEALPHAREAVRLKPVSAPAHSSLGTVLGDLGNLEGARLELEEALRLEPKLSEARISLGVVFARLGRLPEAAASFAAVLQDEPAHAVAHGNLGNVFFQQGNLAEAVRHYERAVELDPAYADAWFNLGMTRAEQGRTADAVRHLQRALELKPDLQPARDLLASLQQPAGPKK
jgi:tetratricopeptide (TPR) repeat protein